MLPAEDLYTPGAFDGVPVTDEAGTVSRRGLRRPCPTSGRRRLNRLLLDAAFPFALVPAPVESVRVSYFGLAPEELTEFFSNRFGGGSISRGNMQTAVKALYSLVCGLIAGPFGVLVALQVSANVIPATFEAGSIDLLLSKPVNRSLTFLTKFAGGCVFVALAALYFTTGLWLIGGVRLGVCGSRA